MIILSEWSILQDDPRPDRIKWEQGVNSQMFAKFYEGDESSQIIIRKYLQYQTIGKNLTQKIFQEFTNKQSIGSVGRLMGICHRETLVLESEEEFNFIMDFSLFEYLVKRNECTLKKLGR